MTKIEHIGIAVKEIAAADKIYRKLLGIDPYKQEEVESEMVLTSFFKNDNCKILNMMKI